MQLGSTFRNLPPVTKNLLIVNIIIWVAIQFFPQSTLIKFEDICALHYFTADTFNPAQLVTYMFLHQDFFHLLFNMFALFMFGMVVEYRLGGKRFLFYYISCGIGAALIQEGVFALMISHYASILPDGAVAAISSGNLADIDTLMNANLSALTLPQWQYIEAISSIYQLVYVPVIGASGAIFGVLLAFGFMYPRQPIYIMFIPIPIQARWVIIGYGALELIQGIGNNAGDNVAHFAHLGGMAIGIIILLIWKRKGLLDGRYF